ncbi:hypothetical protein BGZ65_011769 [Modicella reniformis]|uniref:Uncharacterized protein n=1 Tax=Modicella reniformis TaxID=1440133 RepID=A0A9P6ML79_9FUNG|nr:hypothetical protein BGZ65_011769 [Modicella reniformis]
MNVISQAFRTKSSSEIITIPTRYDSKNRQRVVRWRDIQQYFVSAKGILNGKDAVLFLTDDNLEDLVPLRIAHHPDVVLEVLVADSEQGESNSTSMDLTSTRALTSSNGTSNGYGSMTRNAVALRITEIDDDNQALVIHSSSLPSESEVSLHTNSQLYNTNSHQAVALPRSSPASNASQFIDGRLQRLQLEMDDNNMVQQEQLRQLKEQTQQMQRQMDEVLQQTQQTQHTQQQLQQQLHQQLEQQLQHQLQQHIDEIPQKIQPSEQQIDEIKQQMERAQRQLQKQLDEIPQKIQQFEQQTQQQARQQIEEIFLQAQHSQQRTQQPLRQAQEHVSSTFIQETISQQILIQFRVQALLNASILDLPIPRLFIVLPIHTDLRSLQFRLYFLCECGTHTMFKDLKKTHVVHVTNHDGYDLNRPTELFDKYGSHILTMMYMVKYGAMATGLVVPPLAQFKYVEGADENLGYLGFVKKNFSRLVDDTIAYLEGTIQDTDSNKDLTSAWDWNFADLTDLKSYLEVKEDESASGDLWRMTTQERRCAWVCKEHLREYHERTAQHLKDIVNTNGGTYSETPSKLEIGITTDAVTKRYGGTTTWMFRIQCLNNMWSFLVYDPTSRSHQSTTGIPVDFYDKESVILDFKQFSLKISASKGQVHNVVMAIERLGDLTLNDLELIQQCHFTQLTINHTPQKLNEDRLVNILQQSPKLKKLYIGCHAIRSLAVINLVISSREKIIQSGGSTALSTFELMDEELVNFDIYKPYDDHNHITTTVTFSKTSAAFDMETRINVGDQPPIPEENQISAFFRQYGWSINALNASWNFSDHLATLLANATLERESRLTDLVLSTSPLTTIGLDAIDRVIRLSHSLCYLWLIFDGLEEEARLGKAEFLLGRYGERLNGLSLHGKSIQNWLPRLAKAFPTRNMLPALEALLVGCDSRSDFPRVCVPWIVSMVSSSADGPFSENSQRTMNPSTTLACLKHIELSGSTLHPKDWETLIKAIDFTELEEMYVNDTNFSLPQMDLMMHCIIDGAISVPLKYLDLTCSDLLMYIGADRNALRARIHQAAPEVVTIRGL